MDRHLGKIKTREESGFNYVLSQLNIATPFGQKALKGNKPFFPGQEEALEEEFNRISVLKKTLEKEKSFVEDIYLKVFHCMKDLSNTMERSADSILTTIEIFEVKTLLLKMETFIKLTEGREALIPREYMLEEIASILDMLDPRGDRLNTFYIYEEFSKKLRFLRSEKKSLEIEFRKTQKEHKAKIKEEHGVNLTPRFDYIVSKTDTEELLKISEIEELEIADQDYMSVTFVLSTSKQGFEIQEKISNLAMEIEEEEEAIREKLSKYISDYAKSIMANCHKLGALDFTMARAEHAIKNCCIRSTILKEHVIEIIEGRHLKVEAILKKKGRQYMPVSVSLEEGVTCITGANMGGKTISLKLVSLVATMVQYGFFVPCNQARIGLCNNIHMLIGDSQSIERGLSSFGSEMEELKAILDESKDRTLILVDEIASGTNPIEGLALTKSLMDYLIKRNYISLITTHFDALREKDQIHNLQVIGLNNVDFTKLNREIRYANRKERIDIIGKYMDYRLKVIHGEGEIPKDALNIAKMLGINNEIIENARRYLEK